MDSLLFEESVKGVKWLQSAPQLASEGWLVLRPSFMKKMLGSEDNRKVAFHVCNYENLQKLLAIQKHKKTISTTTVLSREIMMDGMQAGAGLIVVIEGSLIASFDMDRYTAVDASGRRWVNFEHYFAGAADDYKSIAAFTAKAKAQWKKLKKSTKADDKYNAVARYIDWCEEYVQKNHKDFFTVLFGLPYQEGNEYNEILLSEIQIKAVVLYQSMFPEQWVPAGIHMWLHPPKDVRLHDPDGVLDIITSYTNETKVRLRVDDEATMFKQIDAIAAHAVMKNKKAVNFTKAVNAAKEYLQ